MSASASLIISSVLAALLAVFFLYMYFRFLARYKARRDRRKRRETRHHRRRRELRDVELAHVGGGGSEVNIKDPRVERKPVRAEVEVEKRKRGREFVNVSLDDGNDLGDGLPKEGRAGLVAPGNDGSDVDWDSEYEAASLSVSRERRSKTDDPHRADTSSAGSSLHTSSRRRQQHQPPPPRSRIHRPSLADDKVSRDDSTKPETPKPNRQAFPASSFPLPSLTTVSDAPISSRISYRLETPSLPPPAAEEKNSDDRASKWSSSTWSYRVNQDQDGFKQVQARGVPPPSSYSGVRTPHPPLVSGRFVASPALVPPPPAFFVRPPSSVYSAALRPGPGPAPRRSLVRPPSPVVCPAFPTRALAGPKHHRLVDPAPRYERENATENSNPFDDSHCEVHHNEEDNDDDDHGDDHGGWTSRVVSTIYSNQGGGGSFVVGAGRIR